LLSQNLEGDGVKQKMIGFERTQPGGAKETKAVPLMLSKQDARALANAALMHSEMNERLESQKPVAGKFVCTPKEPVTEAKIKWTMERFYKSAEPATDSAVGAYLAIGDKIPYTHKFIFEKYLQINSINLMSIVKKFKSDLNMANWGVFWRGVGSGVLGCLSGISTVTVFNHLPATGWAVGIGVTVLGLIGAGIYRAIRGNELVLDLAKDTQVLIMGLISNLARPIKPVEEEKG